VTLTTLEQLDRLADSWRRLAANAIPTEHLIWSRTVAAVYSAQYELNVVTAGPSDQPSAIAPLGMRNRRLELLGTREFFEPMDFVYEDERALEALAEELARNGAPLFLGRLPTSSPTIAALERAFGSRALIRSSEAPASPSIPLDESWTDPERKFSSDRRSDVRRARRRAEKEGAITSEVVAPGPDEVDPLLDEAFRIEAANWKGREGTALVHDDLRREFFTRYARAAAEAGILRMAFLRIGERGAAMQLAAESGGRFWLLKVGYDEEFKRASPGTLLLMESVKAAAERGLEGYELLGSVEPWTRMWTDQIREHVQLRVYPLRARGAPALASDAFAIARRRLRRK
jgi:hypothetical protein